MIEPVIDLRVTTGVKVFNGATYVENWAFVPLHEYLCGINERRNLQRKVLNAKEWMKRDEPDYTRT